MKTKLLLSLPLVGCFAIVSCYPIPDGPRKKRDQKTDETVTSQDQQKIQEQRDRMKLRDEELKKAEDTTTEIKKTEDKIPTIDPPQEPKKKGDYAFATPVPGKEGFVFSPYNNKLVDVRDIPSGTLVQDPTYPAAEKKYFRVP